MTAYKGSVTYEKSTTAIPQIAVWLMRTAVALNGQSTDMGIEGNDTRLSLLPDS